MKNNCGCDPSLKSDPNTLPIRRASIAVLVDEDGQILICKRPAGKEMSGVWEFPGGKVEGCEVPEEALVRELEEELGIETSTSCMLPASFTSFQSKNYHLILYMFILRKWNGIIVPNENQEMKWVSASELKNFEMPPANRQLVSNLRLFL